MTATILPFPTHVVCAFCDVPVRTERLAQHTRTECRVLASKRAHPANRRHDNNPDGAA